jgi:hypothetical protein
LAPAERVLACQKTLYLFLEALFFLLELLFFAEVRLFEVALAIV